MNNKMVSVKPAKFVDLVMQSVDYKKTAEANKASMRVLAQAVDLVSNTNPRLEDFFWTHKLVKDLLQTRNLIFYVFTRKLADVRMMLRANNPAASEESLLLFNRLFVPPSQDRRVLQLFIDLVEARNPEAKTKYSTVRSSKPFEMMLAALPERYEGTYERETLPEFRKPTVYYWNLLVKAIKDYGLEERYMSDSRAQLVSEAITPLNQFWFHYSSRSRGNPGIFPI